MAGVTINSKKQETGNTYSGDEYSYEFNYEYVSESDCIQRKKQLMEGTDGDNNNNNNDDFHNNNYDPTNHSNPNNQNEQSDQNDHSLYGPPSKYFHIHTNQTIMILQSSII